MAADAAHGGDLAKRWCASCHLVEGGQKQTSADVPSFAAIAAKSNFSPKRWLSARPASEDAELSAEPRRGRGYRRLYRFTAQIGCAEWDSTANANPCRF